MRIFLTLVVLLGACSFPVSAQDYPKGELFGGYQFAHLNPNINASGWNASITGNVNNWLGVSADFSGAYKNGGKVHTVMAGPVFSIRKSKAVTPFAHALFGVAHASGNGASSNAFATALGGGLDVTVNEHVAVRLVQADWLLLRSGEVTDRSNGRVSAGIVFRF
jgi:opacity protein-like surface antigen